MSSLRSDKSDSSPTTRVGVFSDKTYKKGSTIKEEPVEEFGETLDITIR